MSDEDFNLYEEMANNMVKTDRTLNMKRERTRIEELEAKLATLAKAVEMLAKLATDVYPHDWRAIAALAELKGQGDE